MNPISWVILGIIILASLIALFFIIKSRGKSCSCCSKNGCPMKKLNKDIKKIEL